VRDQRATDLLGGSQAERTAMKLPAEQHEANRVAVKTEAPKTSSKIEVIMPESPSIGRAPIWHDRSKAGRMESAARAALELGVGRTSTDAEWATARARLVEFARLLDVWGRKGETIVSGLDKAA
jgi:hypothetical protein